MKTYAELTCLAVLAAPFLCACVIPAQEGQDGPRVIEDKEAIDNADEILKVDDIDVFFIGPSDLSQSMGFPGQYDEPSVAHAIDSTFDKILKADQIAGTPGNADKIRSVLDQGVLYTYTHATKLLGSGADVFFSATGT